MRVQAPHFALLSMHTLQRYFIYLDFYCVVSVVRVTRSLVLCVWCVDRCLSFCPFSLGHYVVCLVIYGF
jgi:hypothetical protein